MVEKKLRSYIIPNVLAMTGTSCYVLADTFFISMAQGANGITALNLVLPVYGLMFAIGSMIGIGSATRYSLRRALDPAEADGYFSNSLFWALLASLPFAAAGLWFPDAVLRWMGADEVILGVGLTYMRIALCFAPCFMLNYTFTAFVRNDGAPNVAMAATLTSGIFNIIFDYVLMFPLGMGMAGAALATGLSPVVSMLICSVHFFSPSNHIRLVRRAPSVRRLVRSCSLGIVAFVGEMSSGITTMVFNFIPARPGGKHRGGGLRCGCQCGSRRYGSAQRRVAGASALCQRDGTARRMLTPSGASTAIPCRSHWALRRCWSFWPECLPARS